LSGKGVKQTTASGVWQEEFQPVGIFARPIPEKKKIHHKGKDSKDF